MSLRLVQRLPGEGGRYADYDHRPLGGRAWHRADLRAIARSRQEEWLADLDAWHRQVSATAGGVFGWWLSPGSRLAAWYPMDLKPLFFALASFEAAGQGPGVLHLTGCPPAAAAIAREWGAEADVPPQPPAPAPAARGALVRSLMAQLRRGMLRTGSRPTRARAIVFSLALDAGMVAAEDDHYFGAMFDHLGDDVLWIYFPDRLGDIGTMRSLQRSRGRRVRFHFDWLGPREMLFTVRDAIRAAVALRALAGRIPPLRIAGRTTTVFASTFAREVIGRAVPVGEIAAHHALRRAMSELRPAAIVYPYEEKGFERGAILARDAASPASRTVAFAHAVYNDGHIYARDGGRHAPQADVLAVTGEAAHRWFVGTAGRPPARVRVVGSPRHRTASGPLPPSGGRRERLRVLFVIGYGHEAGVLASYAEETPGVLGHCEIVVRRYPYAWHQQDEGIARLRQVAPGLRVEHAPLDEQIGWCDVVLYDSTSAGVHAMLRGRAAISVALPDLFSGDLAKGKGDLDGLIRCEGATDLRAALTRIRTLDDDAYLDLERRQARSAAAIYGPVDGPLLRELLLAGPAPSPDPLVS